MKDLQQIKTVLGYVLRDLTLFILDSVSTRRKIMEPNLKSLGQRPH